MQPISTSTNATVALTAGLVATAWISTAAADVPCGELSECRVIVEINATDGDIGFHVLFDADAWAQTIIFDPRGRPIFREKAHGALRRQGLAENFFESAEPVCEPELAEDEDDEVVSLPKFLRRFPDGPYRFLSRRDNGEWLFGWTELTHYLPAAPADVEIEGRTVSWENGTDLGECATGLDRIANPAETPVAAYEVVIEPDTENIISAHTLSVRVPAESHEFTIPEDYLAALVVGFPEAEEIPLKVEVGAIEARPNGSFGNQTFAEEDGFVICKDDGELAICEAEEEDDDEEE